ncbi:MAG: pantoate--beta-alanine ligase [Pyrinomonadaceae bacterium]|nr:pantoate--beta-alanine ligase [Pyrinomonadaceae bacterium]MCX7639088.1 pantoate--beta-alanine ligase [Pyrinomonadaceae bacterium]MDW8303691.1 pantoate--beta-alanine ligase [Acidobacteriota bacterium]
MEIISRRARIASVARKLRRENKTIGFVPTMGALHKGHISLIEQARQMADAVVVSIFVNPIQFNDKEDFQKYPRDLMADATILSEYQVDYIFAPSEEEIYNEGFSTYVYVEGLSDIFEGASRPGHFRGVATIVTILFNLIRPDFAFFGQKDAQQVAVVKRLTKDLGFDTEIVVMPTVREETGLAMSSRNERLTKEQREKASVIYRSLCEAKKAFDSGERNVFVLENLIREELAKEPLAKIDYVAVVENESFKPLEKITEGTKAIALVAVNFAGVRLIDNLLLS